MKPSITVNLEDQFSKDEYLVSGYAPVVEYGGIAPKFIESAAQTYAEVLKPIYQTYVAKVGTKYENEDLARETFEQDHMGQWAFGSTLLEQLETDFIADSDYNYSDEWYDAFGKAMGWI